MAESTTRDHLAPGALTDVPGIEVGHADDPEALTGCTVVLCREGAIAGGAVLGLAPGTRETDLLRPGSLVERVHGVLLTGGSAFGLAAADGVMRCLEEQGIGYDAGVARVPIVPGAVLFDLGLGNAAVRPDAAMGYAACRAARGDETRQGNVGAGMGATVGKLFGIARAIKSGLGTASLRAGRAAQPEAGLSEAAHGKPDAQPLPLIVAALIAVNAFGDVVDPASGRIVAGARTADGKGFADTTAAMRVLLAQEGPAQRQAGQNTVIGVVATNALLDVAQANQVAVAAHDGLARAIRPSHTLFDGDAIFCLATGRVHAHQALVSSLAAEATALAILNAVRAAAPAGGLPSAQEM
jgi:L-aminopeptidase/D-esterase-like protein